MALYTFICRVSDGLPLVASTPDASGRESFDYRKMAADITKRINSRSPSRMSIDAGSGIFNYVIEDGICFLAMCDKSYPRKLVFAYLTDVHREFVAELRASLGDTWAAAVATEDKAYAFLRFDRVLLRLKREYSDPTTKSNTARLAEELTDIHHIMKKNIQEVIDRGEKLENVSKISSRLSSESKKFKLNAQRLNLLSLWRTYAPYLVVVLIVAAVLYWRFAL